MEIFKEHYLTIFIFFVCIALVFDLFVFTKKNQILSVKEAIIQSVFWIIIALLFSFYIQYLYGTPSTIEYLSAYITEKSLSIDNIFVFLLIFKSYKIPEKYIGRALLWGVLLAILFRVIFILLGVELVNRFEWLLGVFGVFLLITGFKMMFQEEEEEMNLEESKFYKFFKKYFKLINEVGHGKIFLKKNNQKYLTLFGLTILMLGAIDLVFALDSIPTVLGISKNWFVILSSNVFAVLGLRALFFLLKNAHEKFDKLQGAIAFILLFIGGKMILSLLGFHINEWISLGVIIISLIFGVVLSLRTKEEK